MYNSKILSKNSLKEIVNHLRSLKRVIVTTNGSYDLLHCGHIKSLEFSKSLGDVLIVGVNSDKSVKAYKGKHRPLVPEDERAYMLASLSCVDYVCIFDEVEIGGSLVELVRPDIHTNSEEWGVECPEKPLLDKYNIKLELIPKFYNLSTTNIIDKIIAIGRDNGCVPSKTLEQQREILDSACSFNDKQV